MTSTLTAARRAVVDTVISEIIAEIRRRIGASFTLGELVELYRDSGAWCLEVAMRTTDQPWAYDLSLVQGAAFDRYARNAVDYRLAELSRSSGRITIWSASIRTISPRRLAQCSANTGSSLTAPSIQKP